VFGVNICLTVTPFSEHQNFNGRDTHTCKHSQTQTHTLLYSNL